MFLDVPVFCGTKWVGLYASFQPSRSFLLRRSIFQTIPELFGKERPLANSLACAAKIVEKHVEVVENTERFYCATTLS